MNKKIASAYTPIQPRCITYSTFYGVLQSLTNKVTSIDIMPSVTATLLSQQTSPLDCMETGAMSPCQISHFFLALFGRHLSLGGGMHEVMGSASQQGIVQVGGGSVVQSFVSKGLLVKLVFVLAGMIYTNLVANNFTPHISDGLFHQNRHT